MAMHPTTIASSTIDLTGLPEQVAQSIKLLVDSIRERLPSGEPTPQRLPLRGRFADLRLSIPAAHIEEARREAWANFPRDFPEPGET